MITLYHGSNVSIANIDLARCNPYKDFGRAFYLTIEKNQAMDVALARVDIFGGEPVINKTVLVSKSGTTVWAILTKRSSFAGCIL